MDWNSFNQELDWAWNAGGTKPTSVQQECQSSTPPPRTAKREAAAKQPNQVECLLQQTIGPWLQWLLGHPEQEQKARALFTYLTFKLLGRRNLAKTPVPESQLNERDRDMYQCIRKEIQQYPDRYSRIKHMTDQEKKYSRRLINYFAVRFVLGQEVSYYLDCRTFPYRVIGSYNCFVQPKILKLIEEGHDIRWINLHHEYKMSKATKGRKTRHAPYRRGISVLSSDNPNIKFNLCEWNFFLWLDDVGGYDSFLHFENQIRKEKTRYDEEKRLARIRTGPKAKRTKISKNQAHISNHTTRGVFIKLPHPFLPQTHNPPRSILEYLRANSVGISS